jgi:predicted metallo-beta-lactamase superfamily hydrolase
MTLEEFEKAVTLLRTVFEETLSMNASIIDDLFKDNNLDDVKEEMKKIGILVFRKRHNDYFVPWHKNLYSENTIDKVRSELIAKTLKEDIEYQELLQKQKELSEELEDVKSKIAKKNRAVLVESRNPNNLIISDKIKSIKASDEPDKIDDMNLF